MKPKKYTIEEAALNLSKLIRQAGVGKDVYITCEGKPVLKLVAIGTGIKK